MASGIPYLPNPHLPPQRSCEPPAYRICHNPLHTLLGPAHRRSGMGLDTRHGAFGNYVLWAGGPHRKVYTVLLLVQNQPQAQRPLMTTLLVFLVRVTRKKSRWCRFSACRAGSSRPSDLARGSSAAAPRRRRPGRDRARCVAQR